MTTSLCCLINSSSGSQKGTGVIADLEQIRRSGGFSGEVLKIDWSSINFQITTAKDHEYVLVGGGDGTLSSILPMLAGSNAKVISLPLGTGNDFARELSHPKLWRDGLKNGIAKLSSLTEKQFATWEVLDPIKDTKLFSFINYISFGFSAHVIRAFANVRDHGLFSHLGRIGNRIAYLLESIKHLSSNLTKGLSYRSGQESDSSMITGNPRCLLFANIRSIMGVAQSNNISNPFDTNLEGLVVPSVFNYIAMLSNGRLAIPTCRMLGSSSWWEIYDIPPNEILQVDGETRAINTSTLRIMPGAPVRVVTLA